MKESIQNSDIATFALAIEALEGKADEYVSFVKKLKGQISKAKTGLTRKPDTAKQIGALIAAIDDFKRVPETLCLKEFRDSLQNELDQLKDRVKSDFPGMLRDAATVNNLDFSQLSDGFSIGPFRLNTNPEKESAALQFAKQDILAQLPLNATAIADAAVRAKTAIVDSPVEVARFTGELHEAMRVSLARQGKSPKQDLRAELPLVIRELLMLRQESKTQRSIEREFLVSRLIVELKTLIQSKENMRSDQQFSLETAVIENTKNSKKSVFIPNDLSRSCGEGTYFQAILLKTV